MDCGEQARHCDCHVSEDNAFDHLTAGAHWPNYHRQYQPFLYVAWHRLGGDSIHFSSKLKIMNRATVSLTWPLWRTSTCSTPFLPSPLPQPSWTLDSSTSDSGSPSGKPKHFGIWKFYWEAKTTSVEMFWESSIRSSSMYSYNRWNLVLLKIYFARHLFFSHIWQIKSAQLLVLCNISSFHVMKRHRFVCFYICICVRSVPSSYRQQP